MFDDWVTAAMDAAGLDEDDMWPLLIVMVTLAIAMVWIVAMWAPMIRS